MMTPFSVLVRFLKDKRHPKVQLENSHIRLINNYYTTNNKKLASLLDLNLKEYNY